LKTWGGGVHEAHNCGDFYEREYVLCFSVCFDAEEIDDDNGEKKNGDEYGLAQVFVPVSYRKGASYYLDGENKQPL
jgi:hypothetical protein